MQNSDFLSEAFGWIVGGSVIILILALIAAYYLWQLRKARQAQAQAIEALKKEQQQEREEKRQKAINSVRILAASLGTDQITWTEGAMRISALLPHITQDVEPHKACSALLELAEKTQHIPILSDWQALSKKEQKAFDKERAGYEKALLTQLQAAVDFLNNWPLIQDAAQNQPLQKAAMPASNPTDLAVRVGN